MSSTAIARELVLHVLAEAVDLGEVRPLNVGAAARPGDLVPVEVPLRLSVSLESLQALAKLGGFADLAEAFEAVSDSCLDLHVN
jgi:hypothetical protein